MAVVVKRNHNVVEKILKVIKDAPDTDQPEKSGIITEVCRVSEGMLLAIKRIEYSSFKPKGLYPDQPCMTIKKGEKIS